MHDLASTFIERTAEGLPAEDHPTLVKIKWALVSSKKKVEEFLWPFNIFMNLIFGQDSAIQDTVAAPQTHQVRKVPCSKMIP